MIEEQEIFKVYEQDKVKHKIEVSNLGRMKVDGRLHHFSGKQRYKMYYCFYLHRMVAELFIPNTEHKPFVDHIDSNRYNNTASNLRWVTYEENANNPSTIKKMKEGWNKPGVRESHAASCKKYADEHPEWKEAISKFQKDYYSNPENRKKHSERMKDKSKGGYKLKGCKYMTDGISKPVLLSPDEWGEFIDIGYYFINTRYIKK